MIPISLYVIIEVQKLILASLIRQDECMYDADTNMKAECRNSDLIEELGQVEFVFSDKTGTLTQNKMDFKRCSINGKVFTDEEKEGDKNKTSDGFLSTTWQSATVQAIGSSHRNETQEKLVQFFTMMAVCHSVVVDRNPKTQEIIYQATSPDEHALVIASKNT
jgi:phospholipid-transporting ATPase